MNVDRAQGAADDAYNRGYENWYNSQQMGYNRQQDMYERLVSLMTTTGYSPSADELTAAGMSAGEMQAYLNYYNKLNPAPVASSSSSSPRRKGDDGNDDAFDENEIATMKANGMSDHEVVGYLSEALRSGQISSAKANELEKKYTKGWI